MFKFCPLFSSSSGNSVYVGTAESGVLFDVGRSAKQIREMLERSGIKSDAVKAIFITHEHSDHVKGLSVFVGKRDIPVYASSGTLLALKMKNIITPQMRDFAVGTDSIEIAGLTVTSFCTSHDCADGRGYIVTDADGVTKAAICTDTGYVSSGVLSVLTGCRLVYIESNHDVAMLKTGEYPYQIQQRILSNIGHLSNDACADALRALVNKGTTQFVLAHLSEKNNTPQLAYEAATNALTEMGALEGRDYLLSVAPPESCGEFFSVG